MTDMNLNGVGSVVGEEISVNVEPLEGRKYEFPNMEVAELLFKTLKRL